MMQLRSSKRKIKSEPRGLKGIKEDFKRFIEIGEGDYKNAKKFNNVINPPFFNIPVGRVSYMHYLYT